MPKRIDWKDVALGTSALDADRVLGALKTYEVTKLNQLASVVCRDDAPHTPVGHRICPRVRPHHHCVAVVAGAHVVAAAPPEQRSPAVTAEQEAQRPRPCPRVRLQHQSRRTVSTAAQTQHRQHLRAKSSAATASRAQQRGHQQGLQ
ncbi:hypothetical protein PF010_g19623 [Phytophthora fragariae]|uniref:Uncharacterized protein n=1 Tax=Phytophthora fragariae TaxID=53985 RepID=A0A6G0NBP6_9STRA|nr:hypothetical protein PF010_g19623 [Phytophthora fragariae]KAE9201437.1 hypothetical protein PF004_g18715 [Phytophthora fragariae]